MNTANRLLVFLALLFALSAHAQLVDIQGDFAWTNDVTPRSFKFRAQAGSLVVRYSVDTRPGTVAFEFRSPDSKLVARQSAGVATVERWLVKVPAPGDYELLVIPQQTIGHWQVRVDQLRARGLLYGHIASGILMMLLAVTAVLFWWFRSGVQWRWFWAGAGIWTVGVLLKFAVALPLNPVVLGKAVPVAGWKLWFGSTYCGLFTGIFEIGITLAAALVWRRLAAEPARAVAVGLGAGAFEALLLGLGAFVGSLVALVSGQADLVLQALAGVSAHTPWLWLTGPVERVLAILAHTASRVLVLRAIANRTWFGFWAGFAWLSAVDFVAGFALLSGMATSGSVWWVELMLVPFGVFSLPLLIWAVRHWPALSVPPQAPPGELTGVTGSAHDFHPQP